MAEQKKDASVLMEGVRIVFRNFAGKAGTYNREGERSFSVILPDDIAEMMAEDGWNVKYLKPREEEEQPTPYLQVKVNYNGARPPRVVMLTSRGRTDLDEDSVELLDWADIAEVDLIVRPYHYDVNGKQGISAYLKSIFVSVNEDELEQKYAFVDEADPRGRAAANDGPPWDED